MIPGSSTITCVPQEQVRSRAYLLQVGPLRPRWRSSNRRSGSLRAVGGTSSRRSGPPWQGGSSDHELSSIHRGDLVLVQTGTMTDAEMVEEWTPLHELVALSSAGSVAEFRRRLITLPSAGGNPADAFEPLCLLDQYHKANGDGVAETALLLVTDRRWRHATGRLIQGIASSGLVPDEELDLLAQAFLAADGYLYWHAPNAWFEGGVEIELEPGVDDEVGSEHDTEVGGGDDRPVVVGREVRPPLQRWAADRLARADPAAWAAILRRGRELNARAGAAILRGLLDAIDALPAATQALLCDLAAQWPQQGVRQAAAAIDARRIASPTTADRETRHEEHRRTNPRCSDPPLERESRAELGP